MAVTDPNASGAIQWGVPIIVPRFCIVLYTYGTGGRGCQSACVAMYMQVSGGDGGGEGQGGLSERGRQCVGTQHRLPCPPTHQGLSQIDEPRLVRRTASGPGPGGQRLFLLSLCVRVGPPTCAATPRSPSLTLPALVSNTFAAFTSRCSARRSVCM